MLGPDLRVAEAAGLLAGERDGPAGAITESVEHSANRMA
jgi:hypothetical protein